MPEHTRAGEWTKSDIEWLIALSYTHNVEQIAAHFKRSVCAVRSKLQKLGLVELRFWSEEEIATVRRMESAGAKPADIAAALPGRTLSSVYQIRVKLGLARQLQLGPDFLKFIREKHAIGWSDPETAAAWNELHPDEKAGNISRECVGVRRRRLGLPNNALSKHRREKVAAKTQDQLKAAGLNSLAELHRTVIQQRIRDMGWPEDLRWTEAQILSLIWDRGPLTKREICAGLGREFHGKKTLSCRDPGGSFLASLIRRGLLVSLRRIVKGRGKGHSVDLYTLPFDIARRATA